MSPPLLSTRMIKSILHHTLCLGHSQRHCAQALGVSKGVVAKYLAAAAAADLDWAVIEPLSETELEQRLVPARVGAATPVVPDYAAIHRELSRKGVTHPHAAVAGIPGQYLRGARSTTDPGELTCFINRPSHSCAS